MKALVIDDQVTARTLLRCILEEYGSVDEAANGGDGLARFLRAVELGERYDLVCVDLGLPDTDGMQLVGKLREAEASVGVGQKRGGATVLVITGSTDPRKAVTAFREQADGFLTKPVSYDGLMAAFAEAGLVNTR